MRDSVARYLHRREFFGHPSGLYVLFFTEMWERFSYYGMRALLVLYMTQYLLTDPARAAEVFGYNSLHNFLVSMYGEMNIQQMSSQIYGLYTGLVYATPLVGGLLADKLWGQRKTVYVGGVLMAIGHFLMASEQHFLFALLFLVLGNGAFKPNISTQVGSLYDENDPRRDSAFGIFYMGINLGATFSPLICGYLGQKVGWHWGFGAAGVGMIFGLAIYWLGSRLLPQDSKHKLAETREVKKSLTSAEKKSIFAIICLCFLNIFFWAIYEQQGNVLQLWVDEKVDWNFWGWEMPSTFFQSLNPALIFILTPLLASYWVWKAKVSKSISSSITKMGIGSIYCGLAYIVIIMAEKFMPAVGKTTPLWTVLTVLIFTLGELYFSPIGLSLVNKMAPRRLLSTMMGVWLLSSAFGNLASGILGSFYSLMSPTQFFLLMTVLGVAAGFFFLIVRRPIEKTLGKTL